MRLREASVPSLRHRVMNAYVGLRRYPRQMRADMRADVINANGPTARQARRLDRFEHEGHTVWVARPREGPPRGRLVHFHGGAFVYALAPPHFAAATRLAEASGAEVWLPEYPLPPHAHAEAVTAWADGLCARAGEAGPYVLSGDSAGANLALGAAQRGAAPERLILLSPWCDLTMRGPGLAEAGADEPLIAADVLAEAGQRYAGDLRPADPLVSPIYADHAGLPPVTLIAGDRDVLYPDIVRLDAAMRAAGADVTTITEPGLGHYWMFYPVPEAKRTWAKVATLTREGADRAVRPL